MGMKKCNTTCQEDRGGGGCIVYAMLKPILLFVGMVLGFGVLYRRMDSASEGKDFGFVDGVDPFYFAGTTAATVGYGNYAPRTTRAKVTVMLQMLLVTVLVVDLVRCMTDLR